MARYYGAIGYGHQTEVPPGSGIHKDVISERQCSGDVLTDSVKSGGDDKVNSDINLGNSFSVLLDGYALENIGAMRYIVWYGGRWSIADVKVQHPRLIIRVGGLYNGPTPTP